MPFRASFENWDQTERYIRRDDVPGLRLWVDLLRMTDDQREDAIRELEEAITIVKDRQTPKANPSSS